jgi:RimJ/RimL family protein N-acetyltransferase
VGSDSLKDEAVALRPWSFADVDEIVECIDGDPEIARWLDQVPQPYTRKDARGYVGGIGEQAFAIVDAESGRLLGSIGVRWNERRDVGEIGYWVRADARGRGVVTRALRLVSRFAFEHEGAARLQLRADVDNVGSRRAAEKAGFSFEGVQRAAHWNERLGRRQDHAMYSLLPGDAVGA